MARIIVNEGQGPRPADLSVSRLVIGGTPDCDLCLRHAGAGGSEFVLEATPTGHRVLRLRGTLLLNEEPCDVADLLHNDTLRAGESMILYKNPDATRPAPAPVVQAPAVAQPAVGKPAAHERSAHVVAPALSAGGDGSLVAFEEAAAEAATAARPAAPALDVPATQAPTTATGPLCFRVPLPPGCNAPTAPPPAHPGPPPQ